MHVLESLAGRCWTGGKAGAGKVGRQVLDRDILDRLAGRCWTGGQKAARARETADMDKPDLFYGFLLICSILR